MTENQDINSLNLGILCAPESRESLSLSDNQMRLQSSGSIFPVVDGIPVLLKNETPAHKKFFEKVYETKSEPWKYSRMAAEVYRHEYVVKAAKSLIGEGSMALDLGCSLGQLTHRFLTLSPYVYAMDIAAKAALRAAQNCRQHWKDFGGGQQPLPFRFVVGSATEIPFKDASFDLVILSDGLVGWDLAPDLQVKALREVHRIMKENSFAILTDFMHPRDMNSYAQRVSDNGFEIMKRDYFYDRLFYQLAVHFRNFRKYSIVERFFESRIAYRICQKISSLRGMRGSKHMALILRKKKNQ